MTATRHVILAFSAAVGLVCLSGCPSASNDRGGGDSGEDQRVVITAGDATQVATATVGTDGGTVRVASPGDPLDGLSIAVPSEAFFEPVTFTVSHSPIVGHNLGDRLDPALPLITIDTGGRRSGMLMVVKIPVQIPKDYHVMAFLYDRTTGSLEGATELTHDDTSLTIATPHFSDILINRLFWGLALEEFDSGFKVTEDNWKFANPTTWLSPGGTCSGMSATALYYYIERKQKLGVPGLYQAYDSDAASLLPAPGPVDDTRVARLRDSARTVRLCAMAQWYEKNYQNQMYDYWYGLGKQRSPLWTFLMFAHAIMLTQQPQYVSIFPEVYPVGHALIVYKKSGNALHVADPNSPTDSSAVIEFNWDDETFKSYTSKWNSGSDAIVFNRVNYVGKTAVVPWDDLAALWNEMDAGAVGNKDWPEYQFKVVQSGSGGATSEVVLSDGYKTSGDNLRLRVDSQYNFDPRLTVFASSGSLLQAYGPTETGAIDVPLIPGDNWIGCRVEGKKPAHETAAGEPEWVWVGFDWFQVTLDQPPLTGDKPQVQISSPLPGATYAYGSTIELNGSAIDPQDGTLQGNSLTWRLDDLCDDQHLRMGCSIAHGETFTLDAIPNLSYWLYREDMFGTHTLSLTATDSEENHTTVSVPFTIRQYTVAECSRTGDLDITVGGIKETTGSVYQGDAYVEVKYTGTTDITVVYQTLLSYTGPNWDFAHLGPTTGKYEDRFDCHYYAAGYNGGAPESRAEVTKVGALSDTGGCEWIGPGFNYEEVGLPMTTVTMPWAGR